MMQQLVIIGNSHAARECYYLFQDMRTHSPEIASTIRFKGFLSYRGFQADLGGLEPFYLGDDRTYHPEQDDRFVIGIADCCLRKQIFEEYKEKKLAFFTLVSPFAQISRDSQLGEANIIGHGCAFSCNISAGNANYFNSGIILGHDVKIGSYNFFGPGVMLLGSVQVGDSNRFAARSMVLDKGSIGNGNSLAPASVIYKGCGHNKRMAGNPAVSID